MLDVAVSYNNYKFLGNEFLTWLWYVIEQDPERIRNEDGIRVLLEVGNKVVLENAMNEESVESITIKGNDAGLEEGRLALKKGAVVTDMQLLYKEPDHEWSFSIKGESLNMSSYKTPDVAKVEKKEEMEGAIIEKAYFCERGINLIDGLYKDYIKLRISGEWQNAVVPKMKEWIKS